MGEITAAAVQANLNIVWVMVAAAMVLFMQAGFTALESGFTRAKNTINVALKNIADFIVAILIFWGVGYALMFGESAGGWSGTSGFLLSGFEQPSDYASFVFQATFAGTAATIVSGAVAERIRFFAYVIISIAISGLIYPISGHWIWNGDGWLATLGMVDFAGSAVVHSLGGWVGLAGALILGPRLGRFNPDGSINKIHGHSLVLAVIGVLILWFGWFGFNGGSVLEGNASIAKIVANTLLASAAGGLSCFFLSSFMNRGEVHVEKLLNGVIGGLVGVTAGCALLEPAGAVFVGASSGVVVYWAEWFLLNVLRIDDPVNAIPAHGFCGAWGTIALAFAAPEQALPLGDMWAQAGVQLLGAGAVFVWGFGMGALVFLLLKGFDFLRVSPEGERQGLNVFEHGASSGLLDTMQVMDNIASAQHGGNGDLTRRVPVEIGSEAGDLAITFNRLMDTYHETVCRLKRDARQVVFGLEAMYEDCRRMEQQTAEQRRLTEEMGQATMQLAASIREVAESTCHAAETADHADQEAGDGRLVVGEAITTLNALAAEVEESASVINRLGANTEQITSIPTTIGTIADQTNLLALNAAIEAARAGETGRGFAVVADEVRSLAAKTQHATIEIQQLLGNLQTEAGNAVTVMKRGCIQAKQGVVQAAAASDSLGRISSAVSAIVTMNQRIAAAAEQQSAAATQLSTNIEHTDALGEQNALGAKNTAEKSQNLLHLATDLQAMLDRFHVLDQPDAAGVYPECA